MIRDVLRDFLASKDVIDKGDYYPLWLQRWDGEQVPLPRQAVRNVLEEIVRSQYPSQYPAVIAKIIESTMKGVRQDRRWSRIFDDWGRYYERPDRFIGDFRCFSVSHA